MSRYTYKDIIIDPNDPRLEDAIGKECYYADTPYTLLIMANQNCISEVLEATAVDSVFPFRLNGGISSVCIILKKTEEPKYRPFKGEELLSVLGRRVIEKNLPENILFKIISIITSVDIKDEKACVCVDKEWVSSKEFLDMREFYNDDGTTSPCGVLVEEEA